MVAAIASVAAIAVIFSITSITVIAPVTSIAAVFMVPVFTLIAMFALVMVFPSVPVFTPFDRCSAFAAMTAVGFRPDDGTDGTAYDRATNCTIRPGIVGACSQQQYQH